MSDRWKPESGDVVAIVPVDVVLLDVDGFLDASGVPMLFPVYTAHRPHEDFDRLFRCVQLLLIHPHSKVSRHVDVP